MIARQQKICGKNCLIFVSCIFMLLVACGVKGPPVPPDYTPPAAVKDLKYSVDDNGIVSLTWSLPESDSKKTGQPESARMFKAQESLEEPVCEGCPLNFRLIKVLSLEKGNLVFREVLQKGYRYHYKVIIVDNTNRNSGDSNVVSLEYR